MKPILIVLVTLLVENIDLVKSDGDFHEKLAKIMVTIEDLKEFCTNRQTNFCSKEQMEMTHFILEERIKNIRIEYELQQEKLRKEEQMRQIILKNQIKMREKLRQHFLDRHF